MADLCGDYEGFANVTELSCSGGGDIGRFATATPHMLTDSGSFKEDGKGSRRQTLIRRSLEAGEFLNLLQGSVPLKVGLNRLENEVGVGNVVRSGVQSQLVCSGCQKLLLYAHGATSVCCAVCNAVMNVPLPGTEMAQLVCGGCHTLLMYIRGATSVQCSCCHTVNLASEANQIAHVNCGNCCTLLMYQYGAGSVKCAVCNFLTSVGDRRGEFLLLSGLNLLIQKFRSLQS